MDPTEKQVSSLENFGIEVPTGITKQECSELLGNLIQKSQADRMYRLAKIDARGIGLDEELNCDGLILIVQEYGVRAGLVACARSGKRWETFIESVKSKDPGVLSEWLTDSGTERMIRDCVDPTAIRERAIRAIVDRQLAFSKANSNYIDTYPPDQQFKVCWNHIRHNPEDGSIREACEILWNERRGVVTTVCAGDEVKSVSANENK